MGTIVPIFLILFMGWKKSQPTAISSLLSGAVSSLILFLRSAAQMLWIVDVRGICAQTECKWNSGLNVHKYLAAANEDEGPRLFLMMSSDKPGGNSTKCNMNTGKAFFLLWGGETGFPERLWSLSVETFKTRLDTVLCKLFWMALLEQEGWKLWSQEVLSILNDSMILWFVRKHNQSVEAS